MLGFLKALLSLVNTISAYFSNRQLIDAGKAEKTVQDVAEVERHVEQAKDAVTIPDAPRTERLRNRFDRSRNSS